MAAASITEPQPSPNRPLRLLFTATILLSSFLLFLIQPMYARMMLPRVGGAAVVWNAALVFFQGALLVGYLYAHLASKRAGPVRHAKWHWVVVLLAAPFLPLMLRPWPGMVATEHPIAWILGTLALGVGLPYFVVSTTSPLIQRWFATTDDPLASDPYFLYAASNVGSFAALLLYPFGIEPRVTLTDQGRLWGGLYLVMAVLLFACSRHVGKRHEDLDDEPTKPVAVREAIVWVFLAFVPSSLMIGTTNYLTTSVASAPLMWVLPLGLYLLTFVFAFARRQWMPQWLLTICASGLIVLALVAEFSGFDLAGPVKFTISVATFFVVTWMCHARLASRRPPHEHLTAFYLLMSTGGVLGGMFAALLAPLAFVRLEEYPLTLVLASAAVFPLVQKRSWLDVGWFGITAGAYAALWKGTDAMGKFGLQAQNGTLWIVLACVVAVGMVRPVRFFAGTLVLTVVGFIFQGASHEVLLRSRSYLGTMSVADSSAGDYRVLIHGTIMHGRQATDPQFKSLPTSYYTQDGPVGDIDRLIPRPPGAKVAAVGLGTGTLAAYGRPGEEWTFYELDPDVVAIAAAKELFTFVSDSRANVKFAVGDARLKLDASHDKYHLIYLDAYSSDNIPLHLMTVEAFEMYLRKLAPGGVLAVHISNRYLDLHEPLAKICEKLGLVQLRARMSFDEEPPDFPSTCEWVAVARSEEDLSGLLASDDWMPIFPSRGARLWSDERASILDVLKPTWFQHLE